MSTKPTTVPLPPSLHRKMKSLAKAEKITVSEAYQRAIEAYITRERPT